DDNKNRIPRNNILLIGAICLVGAMMFSFSLGADLLNFGALLAFMGVNLSSAVRAWSGPRNRILPLLSSALGFVTCTLLWWNLDPKAKIVGSIWACFGILLWLIRR